MYLLFCPQMTAKMGGDQMPNMNSSSPALDPSIYGFGGPKRSLDNGGEPSGYTRTHVTHFILYIHLLTTTLLVVGWTHFFFQNLVHVDKMGSYSCRFWDFLL